MNENYVDSGETSALSENDDPITKTAQTAFGITYVYPWQRLVIANILDAAAQNVPSDTNDDKIDDSDCEERGKQIVLLPTGAGKSLCFMVPALLLEGCTLIFYPLLALMADQERRMIEGGMTPVVFRGAQSPQERKKNFEKIADGAKFILANPEVLRNSQLLEQLSLCKIDHIAIDEAHCVSEWGDSFRPAYLELGTIIAKLGAKTVTAFTATASPTVLERMSEILFGGRAHLVRSDSDRPNIRYAVRYGFIKEKLLLECLANCEKPLIVFCATRRKTEETARLIRAFFRQRSEKAETVRFYHAGLSREEKTACEQWFYPKKDGILTATCAFGMGVDKKDIRTVIHLDPPPTAEAYIQEAGRGGRDGSMAQAILLWSPDDEEKAISFAQGARERVLSDFALAESCRRQILLDALGGEQAACSGCDICDKTANFSRTDEKTAITLLAKKRRRHSRIEFETALEEHLNHYAQEQCGVRFWEQPDCRRITEMLLKQHKMRLRTDFFTKGTVDCSCALRRYSSASGMVTSVLSSDSATV